MKQDEYSSQTREASQSAELHELADLETEWVSGGALDTFMLFPAPLPPPPPPPPG